MQHRLGVQLCKELNLQLHSLENLAAEEPRSIETALNEQCWRKAMEAEMRSIEENKTWQLVNNTSQLNTG